MKLSVIFYLSEEEEKNQLTIDSIINCKTNFDGDMEVLLYGRNEGALSINSMDGCVFVQASQESLGEIDAYNDAIRRATGDYLTMLRGGDVWSDNALMELRNALSKFKKPALVMMKKLMPDGMIGAFSKVVYAEGPTLLELDKFFEGYPFYFGGTFVRASALKNRMFCPDYGLESERAFFLDLCVEHQKVLFLPDATYSSIKTQEGDITFFPDIYEEDWYTKSLQEFWPSYLKKIKETKGTIPLFLQYHVMFTLRCRLHSNLNNLNKHVIPEGQEMAVLESMGPILQYIEDDIIVNCYKLNECTMTDSLKWVLCILKNGKDYRLKKKYVSGMLHCGTDNTVLCRIFNLKTNILFMDYEDGMLHIDGTIHPLLHSISDEVYLRLGENKIKLDYNGRYTLTKVFGESIYKGHSFHVAIPMEQVTDSILYCYADINNETIKIGFCYESHFSRMSGAFDKSYWCFGTSTRYMATKLDDGIRLKVTTKKKQKKQEWSLEKEMLRSFSKRAWLFLLIRRTVFLTRPFMKRRPIWMYLDKIYKGGDSSEYLYRYASAQKEKIKHYYLIDKKTADYKRLKKDGYKPLVRGSLKHRLVFLQADMMVISNSTVFAFNNYGLPNSSYVRDLVDFHVCCVQHGMSVQKIAVAQNRLRDNTRLYFCASEYEIENLSKPIYDYVGYDALKLTGVPRYDGLIDDDKKQIMISPTWRMQAAVPVRTNEGEQRDYNPLFKESTYFKVFNSLINDERLIEAAKTYGYRIKYVLHPIVSSQVEDFDKNDYVDIIPAVGDMSYERMFCESSLMVTDFSGIQFDFAYMRKPLVYLHHKDIPQHYEEGTFFYDTMAFGEITHDNDECIDLLCDYMKNDCKMKEEYVKRADDFFYYDDRNNCERIYRTMIEYQDKKILHK